MTDQIGITHQRIREAADEHPDVRLALQTIFPEAFDWITKRAECFGTREHVIKQNQREYIYLIPDCARNVQCTFEIPSERRSQTSG